MRAVSPQARLRWGALRLEKVRNRPALKIDPESCRLGRDKAFEKVPNIILNMSHEVFKHVISFLDRYESYWMNYFFTSRYHSGPRGRLFVLLYSSRTMCHLNLISCLETPLRCQIYPKSSHSRGKGINSFYLPSFIHHLTFTHSLFPCKLSWDGMGCVLVTSFLRL